MHDGFLRDIAESNRDPVPRLLYADWLEEHGDPRAGFIREAVEGGRMGDLLKAGGGPGNGATWAADLARFLAPSPAYGFLRDVALRLEDHYITAHGQRDQEQSEPSLLEVGLDLLREVAVPTQDELVGFLEVSWVHPTDWVPICVISALGQHPLMAGKGKPEGEDVYSVLRASLNMHAENQWGIGVESRWQAVRMFEWKLWGRSVGLWIEDLTSE